MKVVTILLTFALLLAACTLPQAAGTPEVVSSTSPSAENTPEGSDQTTPESSTDNTATDNLANTQWVLTSFGATGTESEVVGESAVTLEFSSDGQAGGSGGCNSYGGSYTVEGNTITFGEIASTLMACADPALMDQETQYFAALQTASTYEIDGDTLTITYDGGVLTFSRATPESSDATETPATEASTPSPEGEDDATAVPQEEGQSGSTGTSQSFVWSCYLCPGNQAWLFDNGQASRIELPVALEYFFDYAPESGRVLYTTPLPLLGAGPGQISVHDLWVLDMASGQSQPIFSDQTIVEAMWAPDGEHLAYVLATGDTYELHWRALSGEDKLLASDVAFTFSVSPQGDKVAFTRESNYNTAGQPGLYVVDVASGEEQMLADADRAGSGSIEDKPVWSPSGQYMLLPTFGTTAGPGLLRIAADGSEAMALQFDPALSGEEWYGTEPFNPYWIDETQFIASAFGPNGMQGGDSALVLYQLNDALDTIVAGEVITDQGSFVAVDVPGSSVWVQVGTEMRSVPLPM